MQLNCTVSGDAILMWRLEVTSIRYISPFVFTLDLLSPSEWSEKARRKSERKRENTHNNR